MSRRVLILGASGMLGHKLWQRCRDRFDTWATVRSAYQDYERFGLFDPERLVTDLDITDFDRMAQALAAIRPQVVVNCIGIVKQRPAAQDPIAALTVNALFPHRLARLCQAAGCRLVHLSTDCVFSGKKGMYTETDPSDAQDLYGRTKLLGEVDGPGCLTLRSSMVGRELRATNGLVEWFLSNQKAKVRGFTHVVFSGFTTLAMAGIIADIIEQRPELSGVYHVSSEPLSKYDLLCLLRHAFEADIEIEPYAHVRENRSLDGSRFRAETGFRPVPWPEMILQMAHDNTPYNQWRDARHDI